MSYSSYCTHYTLEPLYFIAGSRIIIKSQFIDSADEVIKLNNYVCKLFIYPYGEKDNPISTIPNGLTGSLIFTDEFSYDVKFTLTPDITQNLGGKYIYKIVLSKTYYDYDINVEYGEIVISPSIPYTVPS